jgi:maltose phosphorylase
MAGTWMSIVEGFGGMRVVDGTLSFEPQIPDQWDSFAFKINFRDQIITMKASAKTTTFEISGSEALDILVNGKTITLEPGKEVAA